ncbi:NnrS family protein [Ruegeria arenilitoris]|uniref:NnrS family protein n=1 Tax=Ruegeria arenilitoris TaxID=1173585 RepID=UPI00147DE76A|nr:NnrS family protein [Ruegeria arenilitoris]
MLSSPHRIMFPAAGAAALLGVSGLFLGQDFITYWSPLLGLYAWHAHEMLFGFVGAAFAGYSLTAMRSWSGGGSVSPTGSLLLFALWAMSRLAAIGALGSEPMFIVPTGTAFLLFLAGRLAWAALRAQAVAGGLQALFALFLAICQLAFLTGSAPSFSTVLLVALLVSVVGGRMIAAFTWNWTHQSPTAAHRFRCARVLGDASAAALALTAVLFGLVSVADGPLIGVLLVICTGCEGGRLWLWHSTAVLQDGLLAMLHIAFAWLPAGLSLLAASLYFPDLLAAHDALHVLTVGAVSCAIYAVAARAVARRCGRLRPSAIDSIGYALLCLAAVLRASSADVPAALAWGACWAVFLWRHVQALGRPLERPVFSGRASNRIDPGVADQLP